MSLPRFSVRRPVTTFMIYAAVALLGVIAWTRLPQELFPPITYPQISVYTQYKDAAPEEIELLVTRPIEEVVGTVAGLKRVSSVSKEEVSLVIAEFAWGTNMDFAALGVREKIDLIKERLPRGSEDPVVIKFNPFELPVMVLNVSGTLSSYDLLEVARKQIKKELEKVEGVASVNISGGIDREVLVEVDQGRLNASGTSIVAITEALSKSNLNYPAGTIKEAFYEYLIRTMGEFSLVSEISDVAVNVEEDDEVRRDRAERQQAIQQQREKPLQRERGIAPASRLVLLKDVAVVKDTFKEKTSVSRFNGQENISLSIQKQAGFNTVQVANRVKRSLKQLQLSLPPGVQANIVYDQSAFITQAIRGVLDAAWQGALLAFFVLFFFLRNFWVALNVTAAIPLSILGTLSLMYFAGFSINIISMGGLALGVGLLVDAGVVVVENVTRHRDELGKPPDAAATEGTEEVSTAILGTVLTTIVVFLPMIFVVGIVGQLFKELAFTVTFSNMASLVVSLTLTALLASWTKQKMKISAPSAPDVWLSSVERDVVRWFLDHRWFAVVLVFGLFAFSIAMIGTLAQEFLPKVDQGQFIMRVEFPPGTRLEVTDRVSHRIEKVLMAHPDVKDVTVNIGSSKDRNTTEALETLGSHQGQILVGLVPKPQRKMATGDVIRDLTDSLQRQRLEGVQIEYVLQESVFKSAMSSSAPIAVEVRGERLDQLESLANAAVKELEKIPGLNSVRTSMIPPSPETKVRVQKDRAAAYHLTVSDIALTAQTALKGTVATKFKEGGREIDVRVRLRPQDRKDLGKVRRLLVRSPLQMNVTLADVAYLAVGKGPTEIRRQDQQRVIVVTANLLGRNFGDAIKDVSAAVGGLAVPSGYEVKITGENEQMQESFESLKFALVLSILLVYMIMASTFESLWQPFLIMATIPMSLIGVIVALWVTGTPLSVMVGLGFIILGGIVVDNGIVLIDYVNQLQREGKSTYDALVEASQTRLRPILMTTATTVLGLLPLAFGLGEGAELQGPMAVTVMGGLISGTFLTLVFLPVLYLIGHDIVQAIMPSKLLSPPPVVPEPAFALAGIPAASIESPEIPDDFGREDAVPEASDDSGLVMPIIGMPEVSVQEPPPLSASPASAPPPPAPLAPKPPILMLPPTQSLPVLSAPPPAAQPPIEMPAPPVAQPQQPFEPNERQRWFLEILKTRGRMTRKDYAVEAAVSVPTAARDLRELVDQGLIRGVGPLGPGRTYELTASP